MNIGQLISRACSDESFKARLLSDTMAVLKENGIVVPEDITVKAVENTDKLFHLVIPSQPVGRLSDEDLNKVDAGDRCHTTGGADRRVVRVRLDSWAVVATNLLKRKFLKRG
ncbi:MAG: NHLP leader peptide family RiPP precursor [Nitrospirae bacterium]|nr:NHLP leader peptide family RiPP precursor [Nitrospirota bacterium]